MRPRDDDTARTLASVWHLGQTSALYALASSGYLPRRGQDWELWEEVANIDEPRERDFLAWYVSTRQLREGTWGGHWETGRPRTGRADWAEDVHILPTTSARVPSRRVWWASVWGGYSYVWSDPAGYPALRDILADLADGDQGGFRPCWGDWPTEGYVATITRDPGDGYPVYVVSIGPRGGLRIESA